MKQSFEDKRGFRAFLTTLFCAFFALVANAQTIRVSGVVSDPDGPSVGASIIQKGTTNGTVTDMDGNYSIQVPSDAVLVFSYIGMTTQEIAVGGRTKIDVSLSSNEVLDEVVVVGFGTQKKVNLTGAVAVVSGDELAQRPVANATQALQGMVPGLQIASTAGTKDATPSINVRGTGTIGQGSSSSPLVLIDGVEGDLNTINPQDIESISVLKDAAASSIYGSRAPFGVILITTKSGGKGDAKPVINYNNSFRFGQRIRAKHMMNSVDFASWTNDANANGGEGLFFDADRMAKIKAYHEASHYQNGSRIDKNGNILYAIDTTNGHDGYGYGVDDVDWYDAVYDDTSFSQEHNASVSGSSERVNYYASFNYLDDGGFMKLGCGDKMERFNGTAKLGVKLTDWLRLNYTMRYTRQNYKRPSALTGSLYSDIARQGWPVLPLYDHNGNYFSSPSPALGLATGGKDTSERDITNHQIGFVLEPIKGWKTHVDLNYRIDNKIRHWDSQTTYNHLDDGTPVVYNKDSNVHEDEYKENYMNFQAYTEYDWNIAKAHNFHVMGGFQAEQVKLTEFGLQRNGILDASKPVVDLTTGLNYNGVAVTPSTNGAFNQWQTAGFFGRINYNYKEKYLAEFNLRYDGTSRFRTDNMWKLFPSVSLGWNISREGWFEPLTDVFDVLKLRGSYGQLGNQNTTNWYQTYQTIAYNSAAGNWLQGGVKPNVTSAPGLVSTSLGWETVESYDLGLDFTVLNNRLSGSVDYFVRNTNDMVGNAPELPAILGTAVPVTNNTDLKTTGWELQVTWRDRLDNGFSYSATFNISDSRTKITRYPNNPTNSLNTYIEGRYLGEIWGYETVGIAKSEAEMQSHLSKVDQSGVGSNWGAGDIMYADLNGDGFISAGSNTLADHGDYKLLGNNTPRYLYGLNLSASWKGFDFNAFIQGVAKRDVWIGGAWGANEYLFGATQSGVWWSAGITAVNDYFRDENTWSVKNGYRSANVDSYLPRPVFSGKNVQCQSKYMLNAAYARLKNIQLGYTLPTELTKNWNISNLRFFVSAENIATFTSLPEQFDPELLSNGGSSSAANGYPLTSTWAFGLSLSF